MYDRRIGGRELTFGVSGRLYQSNVLLYDKETESLWSQLKEEAVTGEMTGTKLQPLPSVVTTWEGWRSLHPKTLVLSPETGYSRPYDRNPYENYEASPDVMFPPSRLDRRLLPKERVLGLEVAGEEIAFPFGRLARARSPVALRVGKAQIEVRYDATTSSAEAFVDGRSTPAFSGYWFAWYAFHPKTKLWGETEEPRASAPAKDLPVTIVAHEGSWGDLSGVAPVGEIADAGNFYMIHGTLRNDSGGPVRYVKLLYELLNDEGEVVFREHGYNRRAESLRDEKLERQQRWADETVEAIPASATERFGCSSSATSCRPSGPIASASRKCATPRELPRAPARKRSAGSEARSRRLRAGSSRLWLAVVHACRRLAGPTRAAGPRTRCPAGRRSRRPTRWLPLAGSRSPRTTCGGCAPRGREG